MTPYRSPFYTVRWAECIYFVFSHRTIVKGMYTVWIRKRIAAPRLRTTLIDLGYPGII